jgi:hypothetical protein
MQTLNARGAGSSSEMAVSRVRCGGQAGVKGGVSKNGYGRCRIVSVSIEDIDPGDWETKSYKPDIPDNWEKLYKKPGYKP